MRANEASERIARARKNSFLFVFLPLLVAALLALAFFR